MGAVLSFHEKGGSDSDTEPPFKFLVLQFSLSSIVFAHLLGYPHMYEQPTWEQSEEEREQERRFDEEERILNEIAREHTDEILSPEDWKAYGLDAVYPIDREDFNWAVYVKEFNGNKCVGAKIFDERGLFDQQEFRALDADLPVSTKEDQVNQAIAEKSKAYQDRRAQEKAEHKERMERERGFPEGTYQLSVTYPHLREGTKTIPVHDIRVETDTTREDAFRNARSWLQMIGLHNFGMDFSNAPKETRAAPVHAVLKKDDIEVPFDCMINASGHIVKQEEDA